MWSVWTNSQDGFSCNGSVSPSKKPQEGNATGPDWLLLLLDQCSSEQRDLAKLVHWRACTVHNDITHQFGDSQLERSVHFLLNLRNTMEQSRKQNISGVCHCKYTISKIYHYNSSI
jgi:hypothetical protein